MANKPTPYPQWQKKAAPHPITGVSGLKHAARSKTAGDAIPMNPAEHCDAAFLADRGCFSRIEPKSHPRPIAHRVA